LPQLGAGGVKAPPVAGPDLVLRLISERQGAVRRGFTIMHVDDVVTQRHTMEVLEWLMMLVLLDRRREDNEKAKFFLEMRGLSHASSPV
jgi:hypothetical protein